jgi:O-antigen biosynthesis protein
VQYGSAACLLMRRAVFLGMGGFAHRYEPAYYEDVDLCLRLASRGLKVMCVPASTVIHLANQTALTPGTFGRSSLQTVSEVNRDKFLTLWGDVLAGRARADAGAEPTAGFLAQQPSVTERIRLGMRRGFRPAAGDLTLVQLPEPLDVSSRARRQLAVAAALAATRKVALLTRFPVSAARIAALCDDMGVALQPVTLVSEGELSALGRVAVWVTFDDDPARIIRLPGVRRIHCLSGAPDLVDATAVPLSVLNGAVGTIVVDSGTCRAALLAHAARFGWNAPDIAVIPPVRGWTDRAASPFVPTGVLEIVAPGRFVADRGRQRFDLLVEAARVLAEGAVPFVLRCVGSLPPSDESRELYVALVERAKGLPVTFHLDLPRPHFLRMLRADVIWHAPDEPGAGPSLAVAEAQAMGGVLMTLSGGAAEPKAGQASTFVGLAEQTRQWLENGRTGRRKAPAGRNFADGGHFTAAWRRVADG